MIMMNNANKKNMLYYLMKNIRIKNLNSVVKQYAVANKRNSLFRFFSTTATLLFISLGTVQCTYLGLQSISVETLEAEFQNAHSRYITVDGMRVHYRDEGSGPLLLMLHNELGSLHSWDVLVERLRDRYRIVRVDLPGFGLTDSPPVSGYGRSASVDFISRFIEQLNLSNFSLIGSSYGGFIAWNYALDNPDNVDKLVLLSPIGYTQDLPFAVKLFSVPGVETLTAITTPKPMINRVLKRAFGSHHRLTDDIVERYQHFLLREGNRTNAPRFIKALKKNSRNEYLGLGIKDISMPTFIIWGEQDLWTPVSYLSLWLEDVPDVQFVRYPSVGHYPHEEVPEITAEDIDSYLQGTLDKFPGT